MEIQWDNPVLYVVTFAFFAFIMVALWKFNTGVDTQFKILFSVLALPAIFFVTNFQMNR
jgi:Na+-translocating ferredoxin:NAD+ oxidoreductase RnfD subunit